MPIKLLIDPFKMKKKTVFLKFNIYKVFIIARINLAVISVTVQKFAIFY